MPSPWHACGWHSCRARGGDRVSAGCCGRWFARSAGTPDGGGASCIARSPPRWRHRGRRTARSCPRPSPGQAMAFIIMGHGAGAALLDRQPRLGAVERLDLALLVDAEHHRLVRRAQVEADDILDPVQARGRLFSTNRLSFDSLKPRTRCGLSPCAFQIRRTLVWLRPTVWAIVRVLHWVAAGGFWCRVLSTTCAITSGASGGVRPGRLASRLARRSLAPRSAPASATPSACSCRPPARSTSSQHRPPTAGRCAIAGPISTAYYGPSSNSPAVLDPRQKPDAYL